MHNEYGHMPSGLKSMRDEIFDDFKKQFKKCIIVECNEPSHRTGLCCKHYFRQRRAQAI